MLSMPYIILAQNNGTFSDSSSIKILKEYTYISGFKDFNYSEVIVNTNTKDGSLMGLIDRNGKEVIPTKYNTVSCCTNKKGYILVGKPSKMGLIDKNNNIVIPLKFNYLDTWNDENYIIFSEGSISDVGVMNYKGQIIISNLSNYSTITVLGKNSFATIKDAKFSNDYIPRLLSGKCVIIDEKQNTIKYFPNYTYIGRNIGEGLFEFKSNGKYGAIDAKGNEIIKPLYDEIDVFSDGLLRVNIHNHKYTNKDSYESQYGFIDKKGKVIVPLIYTEIDYKFQEGLVGLRFKDDGWKWGYMDKNQKTIIHGIFQKGEGFSDGLAKVITDDNKNNFIDKTGKIVFTYDEVNTFKNGLAVIKIDGKYAIMNNKGDILLKTKQ